MNVMIKKYNQKLFPLPAAAASADRRNPYVFSSFLFFRNHLPMRCVPTLTLQAFYPCIAAVITS